MKRCPSCNQDLPEEAFYRDRRYPNSFSSSCRECKKAKEREKSFKGYDYKTLSTRPLPQIIEILDSRKLAAFFGISKSTAAKIKDEPWCYVDTPYELNDAVDWKLRKWLEAQC